jgi:hypothetical protein
MYKSAPDLAELVFSSWSQGFMSAVNFANFGAQRPMRDLAAMDQSAQDEFVRRYCDQNPLKSFLQATMALFLSLPEMPD